MYVETESGCNKLGYSTNMLKVLECFLCENEFIAWSNCILDIW